MNQHLVYWSFTIKKLSTTSWTVQLQLGPRFFQYKTMMGVWQMMDKTGEAGCLLCISEVGQDPSIFFNT